MYLIREHIKEDNTSEYIIDEKINGYLIESFVVTLSPHTCSCHYFAESNNKLNHFHINLVENWIRHNKPCAAMYAKSKTGKIVTLCPGFVKVK